MEKKVSIYDIAKYLNVSVATVSYAINGKKKISEDTKAKVMQAIDDLGYVANHTAKTLATGKSHLIGLVLPLNDISVAFLQNPFYAEFIGGLEKEISKRDYDVVIAYIKSYENFKEWIVSRGVDGIVMLGKYPKNVYDDIKKSKIPAVLTDVYEDYSNEFFNVRNDDEYGMYLATKHLIENGHTKIGFVGNKWASLVDSRRFDGYFKALFDSKLPYKDSYYYECLATLDDGSAIANKILEDNKVTAVVCCADVIAIGMMRKYFDSNVQIPERLSIVGYDDIQYSTFAKPQLTTIKQDIEQKGQMAGKLILDSLENGENTRTLIVLTPTLVVRDSVKTLKK